jgi:hypothetical protein
MRYYKIKTSTIYCGTEETHYIASEEPMSEEELRETTEELTRENAESFEYLVTGWDGENIEDMTEDEVQEMLDNYYADCSGEWCEISEEEYKEEMGIE